MRISLVLTLFTLSIIMGTVSSANSATDVTVDGNVTHQVIDGFGGMVAKGSGIRNMSAMPQKEVLDLLFDVNNGIGLSIIRTDLSPSFEPSPGNFNIAVEDEKAWIMNEAKQRGVKTFFVTPWSAPAWMKTNNDINNGGSVKTSSYDDYAEYLARYVKDFKAQYNIDISAVSIQNEPDLTTSYNSCRWTGSQFHNFLRDYLKPEWDAQGLSTKIMMAEQMKWRDDLIQATLNDPVTEPIIDIIAAHGYWTTSPFQLPSASSFNKSVWQTEENSHYGTGANSNDTSINDGLFWANRIHEWLTVGKINGWVWYWLAIGKNWNKDWGSKIIEINGNTYTYARRLWTIGNFSRFVRPGYYRIGCTSKPASGVRTSAYKDPGSGNFVIVAINTNSSAHTLDITLNNLPTSSVAPYTTTATMNLEASLGIAVNGNEFTATLPAKSVTTFTGTTSGTQPPIAEFSASSISGSVPLNVAFTDLSTDTDGTIVSWLWDFGDGNTSTEQNPIHTYPSGGLYTVALTVADDQSVQDIETKTGYISVTGERDAFAQMEAESFDNQFGIQTEACSEGGDNIGYIQNGDYTAYNNVDFGAGATSFNVRAASAKSGGDIELRLDSPTGPLAGACSVPGSGAWQAWTTITCNVNGASGMHDLYLVFTGGSGYLFNVNWFEFTLGGSDTTPPTSPKNFKTI